MFIALALAAALATQDTLNGVRVGEDTITVIDRLGLEPLHGPVEHGKFQIRSFSTDGEKAGMSITFDDKIRQVAVLAGLGSTIADPYGVRLQDNLSRLISLRGAPTSKVGISYFYGSPGEIRWEYDIKAGAVALIAVADCGDPGFCGP